MIAVVQRVTRAAVTVETPPYHASIGAGLCILLGVEHDDTDREAAWIAKKLANLRIFRDDDDKMNRSIIDVGGAALVVSQFTLAGDCAKGNRPSFIGAAAPAEAERLYLDVAHRLEHAHGVPVRTGVFGAMMAIELINDGPVTLIIRRRPTDV
ncbi:MAG: D-tyrosyl-tRNA(Tyr) deacylase [Phycisphaerales bacterium]|nr:D-tyrosyl-tRNA(Tyr) deacylase [Phycisphaerales bacterium]